MKKKTSRLVSVMLVIVVALSFTVCAKAASYTTSPSGTSGSRYTSNPLLMSKLDEIFVGDIDMFSDRGCNNEVSFYLGARLSMNAAYYVKSNATGNVLGGYQCYIYANAVYNKLYGEWVGNGGSYDHSREVLPRGKNSISYSDLVNAGVKTGAYLRTTTNSSGAFSGDYGHSLIILSYDNNGICYLEGNGDGNGIVRVVWQNWSEFNSWTFSSRSRYISHLVQPTDAYYNSIYGVSLPAAPSLTVSPTSTTDDKEVTLTWNACTSATSYSIMYSYNGSSNQSYKTGITSTSYKMSFPKPGTYVVYVDSVNSAGTNPSNKVTVTVGKSLKSISVENLPTKTEYVPDEEFDSSGLTLKLVYSDDTTDIITSGYTLSGFDSSSSGEKEITVSYGGKTATFTVTVLEDLGDLVSIGIDSLPAKTEYTIGESLETDGLVIAAKYSKGYTRKIKTGYSVSEFDSSTVGKKTIVVSFGGKQASFTVSVFLKKDWSEWIRVEDLPTAVKNAEAGMYEFEYADGYRMREKQSVTNGYSALDGWTLDSKVKTGTLYGTWQLNRPSASDNQGATEHTVVSVETKNVYDSYAWVNTAHNYYWYSVTESMYTNEIHIYSSARNFTVDSDNSYVCHASISPSNPGGFGQVYIITDNGNPISYFNSGATNGASYFWANGSRDIYRAITEKYQYTYSKWGDWSGYSVTPITATENRHVETLENGYVRYRVSPEQIKITGISVATLPNKTEYQLGEELDSTGLIVRINYSDGSYETVTGGFVLSGYSSSSVGTKTVTVSYNGVKTTFTVSVYANTEWSEWISVDDLPDFIKTSGKYELEYADGYRSREKSTVTNGYSSLDGWTLDSKVKTGTSYGTWQLNRPSISDNQGATEHTVVSVETKNVYDSYAWVNTAHNYYWSSASAAMYTNEIHIYSSARNFTVDSDNSYVCHASISPSSPGGFGQVFVITDNGTPVSYFNSGATNGKSYFWANGTRDIYRTVTEKYQYTYSKWSDWSDFSMTPAEASATVEVETISNGFVRYRAVETVQEPSSTLKIAGANVSLQESISLFFAVDPACASEYTDLYVEFKKGDVVTTSSETVNLGGRTCFRFSNIAAKEVNDTITVTLYGTFNGKVYKAEEYSYSVATYCYNRLAKSSDAKFKRVCVDLLNYGAAAQTYFSYNTENLANAALTDEQKAFGSTEYSALTDNRTNSGEYTDYGVKAFNLVYEEVIKVLVAVEAKDLNGVVAKVTLDGKVYEIASSEFTPLTIGGVQCYAFYFTNILPNQTRSVFSVTLEKDGVAVGNTMTYSIESYLARQIPRTTNAAYKDLMESTAKYSDACVAMYG